MAQRLATKDAIETIVGECTDAALAYELIDHASAIARLCVGGPILQASYTGEVHDGRRQRRLRPRRSLVNIDGTTPVLVVDAIKINNRTVNPNLYRPLPDDGVIVPCGPGAWPRCEIIEIDYTAGLDEVPGWISAIVIGAVTRSLNLAPGAENLSSEQWGDHSIAYNSASISGRTPGFMRHEEARLARLRGPMVA